MIESIQIITTIALSITLGAMCSLFSYLLDYCFWKGSIFQGWLPFLAFMLINPNDRKECLMLNGKDAQENEMINRASGKFLFKILGGCIVCTNVWVAMISWAIIALFLPIHPIYGIPYVLFSSYLLRKIINH